MLLVFTRAISNTKFEKIEEAFKECIQYENFDKNNLMKLYPDRIFRL